jgi:hypothetical protein
MMVRIRITLTPARHRALINLMKSTEDAKLRLRAHIVLLYSQGLGCCKIAKQLHCVPATAVNTANRYLAFGLQGLDDQRKQNGRRKVTPKLSSAVKRIIKKSPQQFGWRRPTWTKELMIKVLLEKGLPKDQPKNSFQGLQKPGNQMEDCPRNPQMSMACRTTRRAS